MKLSQAPKRRPGPFGTQQLKTQELLHGPGRIPVAGPPKLPEEAGPLALGPRGSWRRERLRGHIERFREGAARRGIPLLPSATAIQPLLAGSEKATLDLARRLAGSGYRVGAIRPPTVPAGTSRLRITLSAAHEHGQIDGLLDALEDSLGAFPIGSAQ